VTWFLLACGAETAALDARAEDMLGAYLLRGSAHVQVTPFPARDYPGTMEATLVQAGAPGRLSVRLESHGLACVLAVSRSERGVLTFPMPSRCVVEVEQPNARGRVDASLRSGHGTVEDGHLTLDLAFDVTGSISTRIPKSRFKLLDVEVTVPEGWTPAVPINGLVASSGSGGRRRP